ncbi:MAG: GTPase ObgE [Nitrospira sp.]|nr:GTPase ObgE [Candidatus Manganitrophaceae bacterium]HIL35199.1 GTPase ObgE [Candidatus Manganitrophaceae bacterium]
MFIDQVKIHVKSGDGGDGCVSFRREKFVPHGGPDGGDGGRGGDIVLEVSPHMATLIDLRYQQRYVVKRGDHGGGKKSFGKHSPDLLIPVPKGTVIRDAETAELVADLTHPGQRVVVVRGGRGGRGNTHFKSATRQAPQMAEPGQKGEERWLQLELKLLADVGLVGLPNAGKSTLISTLSSAHPKIADYPFTTLEPNLGVVTVERSRGRNTQFTVADIPGLISGAHEGKGLGIKFLKHIERTSLLLHLVDVSEPATGDPVDDLEVVREELGLYHHGLSGKPFIVAATKIDIAGEGLRTEALRRECEKEKIPFFAVSSATGKGMDHLIASLVKKVEELRKKIQDSDSSTVSSGNFPGNQDAT